MPIRVDRSAERGRLALDHVGLSVPDLEEAVAFFVEVFDCEHVFTAGPYENSGWVWPGEPEPEVLTLRLAVLRQGDTLNIELLEYTDRTREQPDRAPRPADPGGHHLAFYVEDIHGFERRLRARDDVRFMNATETEEGGPIDGTEWCYFLTPWGLTIELIRWEPGLPYESTTRSRMVPAPWRTMLTEEDE
ncbi:VOC family protein [Leucobacter sp. wl10]|uniref:VOC family protein n=1 Tax=Leucobacter sp. wl10 TaxID=2304677 RepID=UPI000E5B0454|nr:VOC family protein [Leucobacter sp. wl10]RGE19554.1 VOC family protein [Leucobacter sp. wl10]